MLDLLWQLLRVAGGAVLALLLFAMAQGGYPVVLQTVADRIAGAGQSGPMARLGGWVEAAGILMFFVGVALGLLGLVLRVIGLSAAGDFCVGWCLVALAYVIVGGVVWFVSGMVGTAYVFAWRLLTSRSWFSRVHGALLALWAVPAAVLVTAMAWHVAKWLTGVDMLWPLPAAVDRWLAGFLGYAGGVLGLVAVWHGMWLVRVLPD